jgi:ATP-dependent DNA ligase
MNDGVLRMPIEPMLAAPITALPEGSALKGGCWYEPKFDGYRALVFVGDKGARVQSRRGHDITAAFRDVADAAADQLPAGAVVDGELLVWHNGQPDFAALQRRLARRGRGVLTDSAHLIVFDVLHDGTHDLRARPFRMRRAHLERLGDRMTPPLQVVPGTDSLDLAHQWLEDYGRVDVGVEGLVVKGLATKYEPGARGWVKHKFRDTVEVIVGAVVGTPESAERLVLGAYDHDGGLRIVGSTGPLTPPQRRALREHLFSAGEHPWPHEIPSGRLGHWGGDVQLVHLVEPTLVVEVSADRALDHGRWRHVVRYVRPRPDLDAESITRTDP